MKNLLFSTVLAAGLWLALLFMPTNSSAQEPVKDCGGPMTQQDVWWGGALPEWPELTGGYYTSVSALGIRDKNYTTCWAYGFTWATGSFYAGCTDGRCCTEEYMSYDKSTLLNKHFLLYGSLADIGRLDLIYQTAKDGGIKFPISQPCILPNGKIINMNKTIHELIPVSGSNICVLSWEIRTTANTLIVKGSGGVIDIAAQSQTVRNTIAAQQSIQVMYYISYNVAGVYTVPKLLSNVTLTAQAKKLTYQSEYAINSSGQKELLSGRTTIGATANSVQASPSVALADCHTRGLLLEFDGTIPETGTTVQIAGPGGSHNAISVERWEKDGRTLFATLPGDKYFEFPSTVTVNTTGGQYRYVISGPTGDNGYENLSAPTYTERPRVDYDFCSGDVQLLIDKGGWSGVSVPASQATYTNPYYAISKGLTTIDVDANYHYCKKAHTLGGIPVPSIPNKPVVTGNMWVYPDSTTTLKHTNREEGVQYQLNKNGTYEGSWSYRPEAYIMTLSAGTYELSGWYSNSPECTASTHFIIGAKANKLLSVVEYDISSGVKIPVSGEIALNADANANNIPSVPLTSCKTRGLALKFNAPMEPAGITVKVKNHSGAEFSTATITRPDGDLNKIFAEFTNASYFDFPATVTVNMAAMNQTYTYKISGASDTDFNTLPAVAYSYWPQSDYDACEGVQINVIHGSWWHVSVPENQATLVDPIYEHRYRVEQGRTSVDVLARYRQCQQGHTLTGILTSSPSLESFEVERKLRPSKIHIIAYPSSNVDTIKIGKYFCSSDGSPEGTPEIILATFQTDDEIEYYIDENISLDAAKDYYFTLELTGPAACPITYAFRTSGTYIVHLGVVSNSVTQSQSAEAATVETSVTTAGADAPKQYTATLAPTAAGGGEHTRVQITASEGGRAVMRITPVNGGAVQTRNVNLHSGYNEVDLTYLRPPFGWYAVHITYPDGTYEVLQGLVK